MITAGPVDERWLRQHGYRLAAAERARQKRNAAILLDQLLLPEHRDARDGWVCPGQFGGNGQWQPCCAQAGAA